MRVIIDSEGKLEVVQGLAGTVGVQVVDADGTTRPVALAEVVEEVVLASSAVVQVVKGGASVAQDRSASVQADNGGGEDWEALVGRLRVKGRAAMEAAKSWEARAQHFQGVAGKLELQVEEQTTGRGQLASLPLGSALVPVKTEGEVNSLLGAVGAVAVGPVFVVCLAAAEVCGIMGAPGGPAAVWWAERACLVTWGACYLARVLLQACGRPARPWVPVITPEGQYRVRVDRQGEAQVLARRGAEQSWRPARSFVGLPPAPAAKEEGK